MEAASPSVPLLEAVEVLKDTKDSKKRKGPDERVPHVRPRWQPHVFGEDDSIHRAGFEACVLSELKDGLGST